MRIGITAFASALVCMALLALGCTRSASTAEQGSATTSAGTADLAATPTSAPAEQAAAESMPAEAIGAEAASPGAAHSDPAPAEAAPAAAAVKKGCRSVSPTRPMAERCAKAGAVPHTFRNTCAGRCSAIEKGMFCGQAMTDGCRCPTGQCIDDESGCCRAIRR
jgi:hypothetical protein